MKLLGKSLVYKETAKFPVSLELPAAKADNLADVAGQFRPRTTSRYSWDSG